MEQVKNFIEKVENLNFSFWQIFFLLFINFFLRTFFENFVNSNNLGRLNGFTDTIFVYASWWYCVFSLVILVFYLLTRAELKRVATIVAVFSFILYLPSLIDMIIYGSQGHIYNFIIGSYSELVNFFLTVLVPVKVISWGIKIEVWAAVILAGIYIFIKTKRVARTVFGLLFVYFSIFLFLTVPVHMTAIFQGISGNDGVINSQTVAKFYLISDQHNSRTAFRTSVMDFNTFENPTIQKDKNRYSETLSMFLLICNLIIFSLLYFLFQAKKFFEIVKNFRLTRIIHYFFLTSLGVYFGWVFSGQGKFIGSLYDLLSLFSLFLAILFAWLFAVWENDEVDKEIDAISSPGRPFVNGALEKAEWRDIKFIFLLFALSFAWLAGFYALTFIAVYILIYHIYSTPPLRLKRFLGISSLLVAINALLAVWAGFFLFSGTENLGDFPLKYSLGILAIYLLAENVKNIKDIEGDRLAGIKTLPVLLGEKNGKIFVGLMVFLAALLVPFIFFLNPITIFISLFFGLVLFFLINRQKYEETPVFIAYFIFAAVFIFAMIVL